ncbi:60S acidic ribosomal protein P2, variant 3 [Entomophthora muscae]|uniref:60S acidic ribosomal protein P2 n=4 Tax=Entomophthora muscae TaxID=34485 RepID=A0ACC2UKM1_9FUNG|nr:60S acidic ribosomal protein P2 [Entomophthora muscae]KAJ9086913.1 60S acidic ribosomal protein P2, variant 3 [Entomophthora muscae]KAJ9089098.1 60S acidic ribosomal protein P2 [Entomophthora muscae]KAJ9089099.1 60S acidic ribosomal protein P2, variant 3 [Entomophthora muscae]
MRYIAAYLLLQLGGNDAPTADNIKSVLSSVGIDADEERLSTLLKELEGKDINALIAEGSSKLASVGSAVGASSGSAPAAGASAEAPKAAEKVEEKEESDEDMGFGLFD